MSRTTDWAIAVQQELEDQNQLRLGPFRLYTASPDGTAEIVWDRRRGIPLDKPKQTTLAIAKRVALDVLPYGVDLDRPSEHTYRSASDQDWRVQIRPGNGKHSAYVRVHVGDQTPAGWFMADLLIDRG